MYLLTQEYRISALKMLLVSKVASLHQMQPYSTETAGIQEELEDVALPW
jgi:hypothetical protein